MSAHELPAIGQAWAARRVVTFHGQHDTHTPEVVTKDGEIIPNPHPLANKPYATLSLGDIFTMKPGCDPKAAGHAFIPSTYHEYDARSHKTQREHGSFVTLAADIDRGNHPLKQVQSIVSGICRDAAWLIYSSAHACPGDMRWRVIIPLAEPLPFDDWNDAQNALFNVLDRFGLECDRALQRAGQPVYLPNVPDTHAKTGEPLRDEDGTPRFYERATSGTAAPALDLSRGPIATDIALIKQKREAEERERQRLRAEAERRRAERPLDASANIIDEFNRANAIPTLLQLYGYEQCPRNGDDWRSPMQTGESYATRVMGDTWVSLSGSDAGAGLGAKHAAGCYGDAYDLFLHFEHGGDHKAAFRQLYAERRASQPATHSPPPAPDPSDPGWTEMPAGPRDPEEMVIEPVAETETLAVPPVAEGGKPILPFLWFNEAAPNLEANDFVEGLLTAGSMSVIYGPSNCGKTFFVLDLALHVAWGREWRGRAVDQGAIVYLSLEGAQGIQNRITAFRRHHHCDDLPFVAMPRPVDLLASDADVAAVIQLVNYIAAQTGMPVRMVIVDTLSRAMAGGNENSPEDMTALIGNCDRIRDATGAHLCIVHHSGKDEAKGARGHSSLRAATDTEIEIKRDPELARSTVKVVKQRDLEAEDPIAFTLQSVALGTNRRGKPVTSCVVLEAESTVILGRGNKLSPAEIEALQALERTIAIRPKQHNFGGTFDILECAYQSDWKRQLEQDGTMGWDNSEAGRKRWQRTRKALISKGIIIERDGHTAILGTSGT